MNNKKVLPVTSGFTSGDNIQIQSEYRYPTTNREDNPNLGPSNGYRDPTYRRDVEVRIFFSQWRHHVAIFRSSTPMEKYLGSSLFDFFKIHRG